MSDMAAATSSPRNGNRLIELQRVRKSFGAVTALNNVNFDVGPAEVVGLVGDNGAGKSTLIKILAGVYRPDEGKILWEGEEVHLHSPRDAMALGISVAYQDLAIVPLMSIYRNIFLGQEGEVSTKIGPFYILKPRKAKARARALLEEVGIRVRSVDSPVGKLSGGERQAIAIARAVHFKQKLLILDEPTSALSVKETRKVLRYVEEARSQGISVIMITHNMHHVWSVADRFVVLYQGDVVATPTRGEVTMDELSDLVGGGELIGGTATERE